MKSNSIIGLAITVVLMAIAARKSKNISGIGNLRHRAFGGNSGYDGYSMSVRAREARADGKFPKTDFKKVYGLTDKAFRLLNMCDVLTDTEWHHTSSWGNKTKFYDWMESEFAQVYLENKKEIDKLAIDYYNLDGYDGIWEKKKITDRIYDLFGM